MTNDNSSSQQKYADLLIRTGVNLQPGQALVIRAELAHAEFVRRVVAAAYQAGAAYVHVEWQDTLTKRALLRYANVEQIEFPAYEVTRHQQMVDEGWARLALVGPEFPHGLDDVEPQAMRMWDVKRRRAIRFYMDAMMANRYQWCVAAVPAPAWALQVFPDLPAGEAVAALWEEIFRLVRADQIDPAAAWAELNARLQNAASFLKDRQVRAVHFFDPAPGPDGQPATDLIVGLTDRPLWVGGAAQTPAGVAFQPNMPSEEIFCTPHNQRTHGYVRTSRPSYPLERTVDSAYFRFEQGEVVAFDAAVGRDILEQFFAIKGARRLGEVALVDTTSPVFQSGLVFYEILFDENAACHLAFGEAYPECIEGSGEMTREELAAFGANQAETHVDFMIGTPTLRVTGLCADGSQVAIMEQGRFVHLWQPSSAPSI